MPSSIDPSAIDVSQPPPVAPTKAGVRGVFAAIQTQLGLAAGEVSDLMAAQEDLATRTDALELSEGTQDAALSSLEGRTDALEATADAQDLALSALDGRVAALEGGAGGAGDEVFVYPLVPQSSPGGLGSLARSTVELVRWLLDCHPTYPGPGWSLCEARANGGREIPADPHDVDSLSAAVAWKGDGSGLVSGDWVVLRSAPSVEVATQFQVYLELYAADKLRWWLFPLDDFTPQGSGAQSPPTTADGLPAAPGVVGVGSSLVTSSNNFTGAGVMHAAASAAALVLFRDNGSFTNTTMMYLGQVCSVGQAGVPDPRPFAIQSMPQIVYAGIGGGGTTFYRLSRDGSTLIGGTKGDVADGAVYYLVDSTATAAGDLHELFPQWVYFRVANHRQMVALRLLRAVNTALPQRATLSAAGDAAGAPDWVCIGNSASYGSLAFPGDGATAWA